MQNDAVHGEGFMEEERDGREVEQMKWDKTRIIVLEEILVSIFNL